MEITTNDVPVTNNSSVKMKKPQEILVEAIFDRDYDTLVEHEEIERIIGVSRKDNSSKYYHIVGKANTILLNKYQKQLESIAKKGYRFMNPGNYTDDAHKHCKRGFSELKKGKDILDLAPVNDMTAEDRATHTRYKDELNGVIVAVDGALCTLKTLGTKTHPLLNFNKD